LPGEGGKYTIWFGNRAKFLAWFLAQFLAGLLARFLAGLLARFLAGLPAQFLVGLLGAQFLAREAASSRNRRAQ